MLWLTLFAPIQILPIILVISAVRNFRFALSNSGLTESVYVSLKKNMARSYYLSSLIEAVALPQTLSETLTLYLQETHVNRLFDLALVLSPKRKNQPLNRC